MDDGDAGFPSTRELLIGLGLSHRRCCWSSRLSWKWW